MVIVLYAANILQWLIIPQKSTCYYYYYPSAMLLGVAIAIALARSRVRAIKGIRISVVLVAASIVFFLYCYPRMADLQAPYDCAFGCWV
jgi:dolichyl-phosphate-mannose--protein O-mannosyl transferase